MTHLRASDDGPLGTTHSSSKARAEARAALGARIQGSHCVVEPCPSLHMQEQHGIFSESGACKYKLLGCANSISATDITRWLPPQSDMQLTGLPGAAVFPDGKDLLPGDAMDV